MHEIETRWKEIKESVRIERELSDVAYTTWVAPLEIFKVENNVVIILIPSDHVHSLDYISKKFSLDFKVAVSEMMNKEYDIEFILENDEIKREKEKENIPVYNLNYDKELVNQNKKEKLGDKINRLKDSVSDKVEDIKAFINPPADEER